MGSSALVLDVVGGEDLRDRSEEEFTTAFLSSHDFDFKTLQKICKTLDLDHTGKKEALISTIVSESKDSEEVKQTIMKAAVLKSRRFLAFRLVDEVSFPKLANPSDLVGGVGKDRWYGPIVNSSDIDATWYVRSSHVNFKMESETKSAISVVKIRWLSFARICDNIVSLHWQGFSLPQFEGIFPSEYSRFPYWLKIDDLFYQLQTLLKTEFEEIKLHDLVLNKLWEKYRYDHDNYRWIDQKIRAESRGISLNASSGSVYSEGSFELEDFSGIHALAATIRKSIQKELKRSYKMPMPDPDKFDGVILNTLIKNFGPLSYQFGLESIDGRKLIRTHAYFGFKPDSKMPDKVQHLLVLSSYGTCLEQLQFLLDNM